MRLPSKNKNPNSLFSRAVRFMWVRLPYHQIVINVPWHKSGSHQRVMLGLARGEGQPALIDLTALTTTELQAFREAVLIATELAEPIVARLDQGARERLENDGDDSDPRVYRGLPTVVVRKRTFAEYDERLLLRRKDVLSGIGAQLLSGEPVVFERGVVDESVEEPTSAEDLT